MHLAKHPSPCVLVAVSLAVSLLPSNDVLGGVAALTRKSFNLQNCEAQVPPKCTYNTATNTVLVTPDLMDTSALTSYTLTLDATRDVEFLGLTANPYLIIKGGVPAGRTLRVVDTRCAMLRFDYTFNGSLVVEGSDCPVHVKDAFEATVLIDGQKKAFGDKLGLPHYNYFTARGVMVNSTFTVRDFACSSDRATISSRLIDTQVFYDNISCSLEIQGEMTDSTLTIRNSHLLEVFFAPHWKRYGDVLGVNSVIRIQDTAIIRGIVAVPPRSGGQLVIERCSFSGRGYNAVSSYSLVPMDGVNATSSWFAAAIRIGKISASTPGNSHAMDAGSVVIRDSVFDVIVDSDEFDPDTTISAVTIDNSVKLAATSKIVVENCSVTFELSVYEDPSVKMITAVVRFAENVTLVAGAKITLHSVYAPSTDLVVKSGLVADAPPVIDAEPRIRVEAGFAMAVGVYSTSMGVPLTPNNVRPVEGSLAGFAKVPNAWVLDAGSCESARPALCVVAARGHPAAVSPSQIATGTSWSLVVSPARPLVVNGAKFTGPVEIRAPAGGEWGSGMSASLSAVAADSLSSSAAIQGSLLVEDSTIGAVRLPQLKGPSASVVIRDTVVSGSVAAPMPILGTVSLQNCTVGGATASAPPILVSGDKAATNPNPSLGVEESRRRADVATATASVEIRGSVLQVSGTASAAVVETDMVGGSVLLISDTVVNLAAESAVVAFRGTGGMGAGSRLTLTEVYAPFVGDVLAAEADTNVSVNAHVQACVYEAARDAHRSPSEFLLTHRRLGPPQFSAVTELSMCAPGELGGGGLPPGTAPSESPLEKPGAIVGIVLGCIVFVALVAGAVGIVVMYRNSLQSAGVSTNGIAAVVLAADATDNPDRITSNVGGYPFGAAPQEESGNPVPV